MFYQELDRYCPGSKFIHVTRDTEKWIRSVICDFSERPNAIHELIYGASSPKGFEEMWVARCERHNAEVRDFFRDRPQDCLHLDLDAGDVNWQSICPFLGVEPPDAPWPHLNAAASKRRRLWLASLGQKLNQFLWDQD